MWPTCCWCARKGGSKNWRSAPRWARDGAALLAESVTLGVLGGAVGVAFAYGAIRLLIALGPANVPRLDLIAIDSRALLFTLAISLAAGAGFGLIPALKYGRARVAA